MTLVRSKVGGSEFFAKSAVNGYSVPHAAWEMLVDDFCYLPFQFGVRLFRNASMPSRKSSLM